MSFSVLQLQAGFLAVETRVDGCMDLISFFFSFKVGPSSAFFCYGLVWFLPTSILATRTQRLRRGQHPAQQRISQSVGRSVSSKLSLSAACSLSRVLPL